MLPVKNLKELAIFGLVFHKCGAEVLANVVYYVFICLTYFKNKYIFYAHSGELRKKILLLALASTALSAQAQNKT